MQYRIEEECSREGCTNFIFNLKRRLCLSHQTLRSREGVTEICQLDGCNSRRYAKGWCDVHYQQTLQGKEPYLIVHRWDLGKCQVEGCDNDSVTVKWNVCNGHVQQIHMKGIAVADMKPLQARPGFNEDGTRTCVVCNQDKSPDEFYRRIQTRDGKFYYSGKCKPCYIDHEYSRRGLRSGAVDG